MSVARITAIACLWMIGLVSALFPQDKPYVILISFDGFRWDYIERGATPHLAALRDQGASAISLKPVFPTKTFPNHYSLVTGQYAENHGLIANNFTDPFSGERYSLRDPQAVQQARWYLGEAFWETAERQGITSACYFWPGSEMNLPYRRATYFEHYEHTRPYENRVQGILDWLALPEPERPHFITLYLDAVDGAGHEFGPDAPETDRAIARVDSMLGLLLRGLQTLGLRERTNLIIVSDHGMTAIDPERRIDVTPLLGDLECDIEDWGPLMLVTPRHADVDTVYRRLKQHARNFNVYTKHTMPTDFHYARHPFIPPLVLVAEVGWMLVQNNRSFRLRGQHGYDPNHLDMHGVFVASGPAFKKGYRTGTLWAIDLYPLLCRLFDILPRQNIDGELERIQAILVE